jgi:ribosomal protein S18 acetylase RimI-like enzyme
MSSRFQLAAEKDLPQLLELMRELYQHEKLNFNEEAARSGLNKTLLDPTVGSAYLILADEEVAGYLLLTSCFSLEQQGKFILLDELYIREQFRRRGLARSAVQFAETVCRKMGIKSLRLEVIRKNKPAQALYDSMGFAREERYLYTKRM